MITKVLACKTPFEVLEIIDRKVRLISKKTDDGRFIIQFINNSLGKLKHLNETAKDAEQHAKIRSAIGHLQNLKMHFKAR